MPVVMCPLVLLMLAALIHGSSAIRCYNCASDYDEECDDPLDTGKAEEIACDANVSACGKAKGTMKSENNSIIAVCYGRPM